MTLYYSMKQMLRSPVKSILFFLLVSVSAFLLALGGNLWKINSDMLKEFEDIFKTVGTVDQKRDHIQTGARWDAGKGEYTWEHYAMYGERISDEVLDFEGAGYVLDAKQRPYFGALMDQKVRGTGNMDLLVAEVTPLETGMADSSFPVRVEKVLSGELNEGDTIYICDHYSFEEGEYKARSFEAGKTYIMMLDSVSFVHGPRVSHIAPEEYVSEYMPINSVASSQYTLKGEKVYDAVGEAEDSRVFDEVTEGFYETERGKRWLEMAKSQELQFRTIPVEPVDGTELLLPFYQKNAQISDGRDITEEEYREGKKVCLIPFDLAVLLRKKVGDSLNLPLYFADYKPRESYGLGFQTSLLNAEGETYPVFYEQQYEIVGIYKMPPSSGDGEYSLAPKEVVIPWNSIPENAWEDNIVSFYPMTGSTTSFRIPNGTIEDFMAAWEKMGVEGLEFKFYDNGYTQLKSGIESRRLMSYIFLISGCVLAVMILLFFSNLFITGQQERIAVERLLGRTRKQCAVSILTGLLILAAAGCAAGSISGWMATEKAVKATERTTKFDTTFSNAVIDQGDEDERKAQTTVVKNDAWMAAGAGCGMLLAAAVVSAGFMRQVLKKEPLQILGKLEE